MPILLMCMTGDLSGSRFEIDEAATIGSGSDNDVVLPANMISCRHARIHYDAELDQYVIEDLNSSNGTRLDGDRLTQAENLARLNVLTFAEVHDFICMRIGAKAEAVAQADVGEETEPTGDADAAEGPATGEQPSTDQADISDATNTEDEAGSPAGAEAASVEQDTEVETAAARQAPSSPDVPETTDEQTTE